VLQIDRRFLGFRRKDFWFCERPFDVPDCDGVIFYSCPNKADITGFVRRDFTTIVIDLTQDEDRLWKCIDFWTRKKINKARNNGVEVMINRNYREFHDIYRAFRRDKGLVPYSLDPEFMKKNGTLFVASLDGEIVSGHFFLSDGKHLRGLITGSKRLETDRHRANVIGYANRLIVWEAMRYARQKGITEYDMGGYYTGPSKDGQMERINTYKAGFGGSVATRYHYEKSYSRLFSLTQKAYHAGASRWPRGKRRNASGSAAIT
jgi:FemAB family.